MLRKRHTTVAATLACALTALCLPAFASAASRTFTVNGTGDGANKNECETAITTDECTLRGAIEAANSTTETDTIDFDSLIFDAGSGVSTIGISSALPAITEPVAINAGECPVATFNNVKGPCAEVISSASAQNVFTVEASLTVIRGIAINGGKNGIAVKPGSKPFFANNDWFGVKLDKSIGGGSANAGILLEPGAEGAEIGGEAVADRDVFDASPVGIEIRGASLNEVEGNFIGLYPDGSFSFGRSLKEVGVRIVDSTVPPAKAENNEIGGPREVGAKSEECSGPCNAIATEETPGIGIAIESATGPTWVSGNYFGLSPDGSAVSQSRSKVGVLAKPSGTAQGEIAIGGATAATEGNLFAEGEYGVEAEGAEHLAVLGNSFGLTAAGGKIEHGRATEAAIRVRSQGLAAGATIEANSINAEGSRGIESLFTGSEILGNHIVGGGPAILTKETDGGVGNLIRGDTLTEPSTTGISVKNSANLVSANTITKPARFGVEIEGEVIPPPWVEANVVVGNTISEAGEIGIEVGSNATNNRVGGDAPGEANTITKSAGTGERDGAITIVSRTEGRNEVAANTGFGNSPRFIKLISHGGPEKPNGGIKPPAFATVLQSSATGTAEPNATVRIFSKASAETGELGGLLKVVKADAAGNWGATYGPVPVGTLVTATQTSTEGATSELTTAVAASADPSTGGGSSGSGSTNNPPPPPPPPPAPPKAPKVKVTAGPKKSSTATTAKFKFKAEPAAGAKFECKLDNAKWARCSSPTTYKKLKVGKHTFRVRATANGKTGAATIYKFTVKE